MSGEKFSLANLKHLNLFTFVLVAQGSMCWKCGHGTRTTSKRWAKCRQCGERVRRHSDDEINAILNTDSPEA